jgi:hypothetical protein
MSVTAWSQDQGGSGSLSGVGLFYISVHNGTDANLHRVHHPIEVLT